MVGLSDLPVELLRFGYAALVFVESSKWVKSQSNDLMELKISLTNADLLRNVFEHSIKSKTNGKTHKLTEIIHAANKANGFLRVLGFIPIFLLTFGILIGMGIESGVMEFVSIKIAGYLLYAGSILLIAYVVYKLYLKIPIYLIDLHDNYKDKSILKVLFNIYPLW